MRRHQSESGGQRGLSRADVIVAAALAAVVPALVTHGVTLFVANGNTARVQQTLGHSNSARAATPNQLVVSINAEQAEVIDATVAVEPRALFAASR